MRLFITLAFLFFTTAGLMAAPNGPTLNFDYGIGKPIDNPLNKFMYFVPLISPEIIFVSTNSGSTQCARVLSFDSKTNGNAFHVTCEFDFTGTGWQRNVFDHAAKIHLREADLKAGKSLTHQIASIDVQGSGSGTLEIEGVFSNGVRTATEMRMRFNSHGHTSPVSITLQDISYRDGTIHFENDTVARVNTLTFFKKSGAPKMEVTLASVKRKDASNSRWQNFVGGIKGAAANILLPSLNVTADGHQAMMDFGVALAEKKPAFTFPFATRLKDSVATVP